MEVLALNADQTMSSLEIAELTGKLHKNVMADVKSLISQEAITELMFQPSAYKDASGKSNPMFNLDFESTMVLVTGYDAKRRSVVIKRWLALEKGEAVPTAAQPVTPPVSIPEGMSEWGVEAITLKCVMDTFKTPEHLVATEVTKRVYELDGPDIRHIVGDLPCAQKVLEEEIYLEPTELGKHFGLSAVKMNNRLGSLGLQEKKDKQWARTSIGKTMSVKHAWSKGSKSGYNYKWSLAKVSEIMG